MNEKEKNILLQKIVNHLIINSAFSDELGLYHGKMGIVLFFYRYARYTKNPIYEDFADYLLDEICNEIHDQLSINFEDGLCGIGWGILYLLKNGFVTGNPEDILEDVDYKIKEVNLLMVRDLSLEKGLRGIVAYLSWRLSFSDAKSNFDSDFISDLQNVITYRKIETEFCLDEIFNLPTCSSLDKLTTVSLGLRNGYAGLGFKLMTT